MAGNSVAVVLPNPLANAGSADAIAFAEKRSEAGSKSAGPGSPLLPICIGSGGFRASAAGSLG